MKKARKAALASSSAVDAAPKSLLDRFRSTHQKRTPVAPPANLPTGSFWVLFYSGNPTAPGAFPEVVAAERVDSWHDALLTAIGLLEQQQIDVKKTVAAAFSTSAVVGAFVHGTITMVTEGSVPVGGGASVQVSRAGVSNGTQEYLITPPVEGLQPRMSRAAVQNSILRLSTAVSKEVGEAAEEFLARRTRDSNGFLYATVNATPGGQKRLIERCGKCKEWWPLHDRDEPVKQATPISGRLVTHLSNETHVAHEWNVQPAEMSTVAALVESGQLSLGEAWRERMAQASEAPKPLEDRLTELTLMYQAAKTSSEMSTTAHPKQVAALERLADAIDGLVALLELDEDDDAVLGLLAKATALRSVVGKLAVEMTMRDPTPEPAPHRGRASVGIDLSSLGAATWQPVGISQPALRSVPVQSVPPSPSNPPLNPPLRSPWTPALVKEDELEEELEAEAEEEDEGIFTGNVLDADEEE